MPTLFKNNFVRIGIISVLLFSFVTSLAAPTAFATHINGSPTEGHDQAGGKANVDPATTDISWTTKIGQFIGNFILYIASQVTYMGGMLLEISIDKFILHLADFLKDGIGTTIETIWRVIRDISNLAFIFGFIYIGIMTIIDSSSANTKRMLASIIIGALLINFSLFFTRIIIDVSNYIAVEVNNTLISGSGSISQKFADIMGVVTFYKQLPDPNKVANLTTGGNIGFYFMGAIFLIVAGFVLASGAILLIIRFVTLVFIMVFSPLLFAATVFPQTQSLASDLWKRLISTAFFAPAYLLLLLVSIRILEGFMTAINGGTINKYALSEAISGKPDAYGVVLNFIVAIMFLIMSLKAAQKFGIAGADRVMSVGNSLRGKVQSAVGRNTIGRASASLLKDYDQINAGAKQTRTGRFLGGALKYGSLGALSDRNIRGTLEGGKKAKFGGSYSHADDKAYDSEQKKRQASTTKTWNFNETILKGIKKGDAAPENERIALERAVADASTKQLEELKQDQRTALVKYMTQSQIDALNKSEGLSEVEKDEINKVRSDIFKQKFGFDADASPDLRNEISKANVDQLSAFGAEHLTQSRYAVRLTNSQMDDLKKKVTPTEYGRIDSARKAAMKELAENDGNIDGKTAQNHILKMKAGDMSKLPREVLIALAPSLPTATLIEIAKQNTLNAEDQKAIREGIETTIDEYTGGDHRVSPEDKRQLEAVQEFLDNNPYGKQFGR